MQSIHFEKRFCEERWTRGVVSASTRVFDALLPAGDGERGEINAHSRSSRPKAQPTKPNSTWLILIERSGSRSQIKLMYASHHQQPQKHGRNDEDDPFLVVEEPSMMHAIHGKPPSGYHAPPNPIHYHIYCRRPSLNLIRTCIPTPISGHPIAPSKQSRHR
jgi:hypothetical protein